MDISASISLNQSQISYPGSFDDSNSSVISSKSQAIPSNLINEEWQIVLSSDASIPDLENAISRCKELVMSSEECSDERKWLVRHLVEMRFALKELASSMEDPLEKEKAQAKVILGHHFKLMPRGKSFQIPFPSCVPLLPVVGKTKIYCDHCTGIIWTVLQDSYECTDCGYLVHQKCIEGVIRICAHVVVSEMNQPIMEICPEVGLHIQQYKCKECGCSFNLESQASEQARLCDYDGCFYCQNCHWGDTSVIPARVVHNWDFTPQKVSRPSLQQINLFLDKPNINLEEANPKLFVFLAKLTAVRKLREDLVIMKRYLIECREAIKTKLIDQSLKDRRHLIQSPDIYSVTDLIQVENESLSEFLFKAFNEFDNHIRNCNICSGKGYICEICGNNEVLYPYEDGAVPCDKCNSIYHRACWTRKTGNCPKCKRIEERYAKEEQEILLQKNDENIIDEEIDEAVEAV